MWEEREERRGHKKKCTRSKNPPKNRNPDQGETRSLGVLLSGTSWCVRHACVLRQIERRLLHSVEQQKASKKNQKSSMHEGARLLRGHKGWTPRRIEWTSFSRDLDQLVNEAESVPCLSLLSLWMKVRVERSYRIKKM